MDPLAPPPLPPGQILDLPGRGRTWVVDTGPAGGPATGQGRPPLLLLHGWTSTAGVNWFRCFSALAPEHRVVAVDHRGHGRGIRSRRPFRLEDCADDAAAVVHALGLGPVTAVGYSMGGPIAQLLWRRHPEVVESLVLCATAARFPSRHRFPRLFDAASFTLSLGLTAVPAGVTRRALRRVLHTRRGEGMAPWVRAEWEGHSPAALVQAGLSLNRFDATGWLPLVDVPTSVVVTTEDRTVEPATQWALQGAIPGAEAFTVCADHRACVDDAEAFVPALAAACRAAQARAARARATPGRRAAGPAQPRARSTARAASTTASA